MIRVAVRPELLTWAIERARITQDDLRPRFPKLAEWKGGTTKPTLQQLEDFARATFVPVGYLLLPKPPDERLPIPDLRTIRNRPLARPSPDLLETLYLCDQRQTWYREFARAEGADRSPFVGISSIQHSVVTTAARMREALHFDLDARRPCSTWAEALRLFFEQAEALGVLVMANGVVGNNTRRRLDPDEFRGFAMVDDLAPLVFVNAADTKAGQMFTLAHELAHLWLGESALSDVGLGASKHRVEQWCNQVAAELLVPLAALRRDLRAREPLAGALTRLSRVFRVSSLVMLRRLHDVGKITRAEFEETYAAETRRFRSVKKGSGGDFYRTQAVRISKRFLHGLLSSTFAGETLYTDAMRMVGVSSVTTLRELGRRMGMPG